MMKHSLTLLLVLFISTGYSQQVDGGNGHAIILDKDGDVWTIGRNYFGQLGVKDVKNATAAIRVKSLPKIKEIARGYDHSIAIDVDGYLWSWGRNNYGQVGSRLPKDFFEPLKLEGHKDFIAAEGGFWHTVALKENGTVWAWGHNTYGELGDLSKEHSSKPVQVVLENGKPLTDIVKIASVGNHTLALNSKGEIYSWGGNILGQLGHSESMASQAFAAKIEGMNNMESVATGWHHSVALDSNGVLYLWGSDPSTRFDGHMGETFDGIEKMEGLPKMKTIACGSWHSMSTDFEGNLWGWGRNSFGIMGTGDTLAYTYPKMIEGYSDVCTIGGGCFQSLVVDKNGEIWTSGSNTDGQQGTGGYDNIHAPHKLELNDLPIDEITAQNESGFSFNYKWGIVIASFIANILLFSLLVRKRKMA